MTNHLGFISTDLCAAPIPVRVPWSRPSPNLGLWFQELLRRHEQLNDWLLHDRPAKFWLTGFFNPQGFLPSTRPEPIRIQRPLRFTNGASKELPEVNATCTRLGFRMKEIYFSEILRPSCKMTSILRVVFFHLHELFAIDFTPAFVQLGWQLITCPQAPIRCPRASAGADLRETGGLPHPGICFKGATH